MPHQTAHDDEAPPRPMDYAPEKSTRSRRYAARLALFLALAASLYVLTPMAGYFIVHSDAGRVRAGMSRAELDAQLPFYIATIVPASSIRGWEPRLDPAVTVIEYRHRILGEHFHVIMNPSGSVQRAIPTYE